MTQLMRYIPSINQLQETAVFQSLLKTQDLSFEVLSDQLKKVVGDLREALIKEQLTVEKPYTEQFTQLIFDTLTNNVSNMMTKGLTRVINGTGTILHTNLGRARLSQAAVDEVRKAAENYTNLEFDLAKGERGSRYAHVEDLLKQITGAEAAMVVNNNASAVFLVLRALAKKKDVIVSRGELVEIGGSFRISSIMEESDAQLVEVGTTNKTHPKDYEAAITSETAMLLKVHQSNFGMYGFTASVDRTILKKIATAHDIILYEDLGSGAFFDFKKYGIGEEPHVSDVIHEGVDLVSCSGDKLLGGPQVGIILGKKVWVDKLKSHQLARALRIDKMTLAALHATLKDYLSPDLLVEKNPTVRDIVSSAASVSKRVDKVLAALEGQVGFNIEKIETESAIGGGTMPGVTIPSFALAIKSPAYPAHILAKTLRENTPPLVARIKEETLIIDFRTITTDELPIVIKILKDLNK